MNSSDSKGDQTRVGRPSVMTPEILQKLRAAFLIGASDKEACSYAEIGESTLYDYQKQNPEFSEQKEVWKEQPILKARQSVVNGLANPDLALKYLELKKRDEFYRKQKNDSDIKGELTLKGLIEVIANNENKPVPLAEHSST